MNHVEIEGMAIRVERNVYTGDREFEVAVVTLEVPRDRGGSDKIQVRAYDDLVDAWSAVEETETVKAIGSLRINHKKTDGTWKTFVHVKATEPPIREDGVANLEETAGENLEKIEVPF